MYIDTHCHFDVEEFDVDRASVAQAAVNAGVEAIVIPGYVQSKWQPLIKLCQTINSPILLPAPGLHPMYVAEHKDEYLSELDALFATHPECVAVGEIGLDYFVAELKGEAVKVRQQFLFRAQLAIAAKYQKPVILHVRKAHADVLAILKETKFAFGGIVHAWSGGIEEARAYHKLGFRLGIGGAVTYDQAKRLRSVVEQMPLEALVLETDAPDMIPQPHRNPEAVSGKTRNSPAFIPSVAQSLASLKQIPLAELLVSMRANSIDALKLPLR